MRAICLLSILFLWSSPVVAQQRFEKFNVESGLSQNSILALLQDSKGFIWIGTEDGLNRYDGYSFKKYHQEDANPEGLADDHVWSLLESKDGHLWIGHGKGISRLNAVTGKFDNVVFRKNLVVVSAFEDSKGNLWFGTAGDGIIRLNSKSHKPSFLLNNQPSLAPYDPSGWRIASNHVIAISEIDGRIIFGTRGAGLFVVNGDKIERDASIKDNFFLINDIWSILQHRSGKLYFGTSHGLGVTDAAFQSLRIFTSNSEPTALSFDRISRLIADGDRGIWIATYGGGLNHFDLASERFTNFRHNELDPGSLSNDLVFALLEDRNKNLWVGTWSGGLHKLSKYRDYIQTLNSKSGLPDFVVDIDSKADSLLVASYSDGLFFASTSDPSHFRRVPTPPGTYILHVDIGAKYLWLGLDGQGVLYTPRSATAPSWRHIKRIAGNSNTLNNHLVDAVKEDSFGRLWLGTRGSGLKRLIPELPYGSPGCIQHFTFDEGDSTSLSDNFVTDINVDHAGYLWVGTANGICRSLRPLTRDTLFSGFMRLGSGRITTLSVRKDNVVFVGTDQGLFLIVEGEWRPVKDFHGEFINGIAWDNKETLWVSTNSGLYAKLSSGLVRRFTSRDGLQSNEFNARSVTVDRLGKIYFGGVNGINTINPEVLETVSSPARVEILSVRINNERDVMETQGIELTHEDRVIEFEFSLLDFVNPSKNEYEYMLDGFDKAWVKTTSDRRVATYTNLDPGDYTFMIRAVSSEGVKSDRGVTFFIENLPPPWRTVWAYAGYGTLILAIIYFARRGVITREQLKAKLQVDEIELTKLKELDDFKSSFFANISHEFRTPLTLILGQLQELEKDSPESARRIISSIRKSSKTALNLVSQLLDLSRVDAGKFTLSVMRLPAALFFKHLAFTFRDAAIHKGITWEVELPDDGVTIVADPSVLEKVTSNLISNAVKYTPRGGKTALNVTTDSSFLKIEIDDTGIGIDQDQLDKIFDRFYRATDQGEGTGIGLSLTKELVRMHKGEITVKSMSGEGTRFMVCIPSRREDYPEIPDPISFWSMPNEADIALVDEKIELPQNIKEGAPVLLVIEDNADLLAYLKRNMVSSFEIILARDGKEGLEKAKKTLPDIILCDWMMPQKSGIDVCYELKTNELTSHIPIVLLTARADTASKMEGLEIGADDYITKPFELRELMIRMNNLINQRKLLRLKFGKQGLVDYKHVKVSSYDEKFMERLNSVLGQRLSDSALTVEVLAKEMAVSRVQLHRKVTALTGFSASDLIREYRLERAADLLRQQAGNVSDIAFQVGFENLSYFTKVFKEKFKTTPSDFTHSR